MSNKIIVIVLIAIVVVGGAFYFSKGANTPSANTDSNSATNTTVDTSVQIQTPLEENPILPTQPTPAPKTTNPVTDNVTISNFAFAEKSVSIKVGDSVLWTNKDSAPHTVTGDGGLSSGTLKTNQTYSFTFNTAGTFNYHCAFHPSMTGTVTVTN